MHILLIRKGVKVIQKKLYTYAGETLKRDIQELGLPSKDTGSRIKRNSELLSVLNSLPDSMQKMMRNG